MADPNNQDLRLLLYSFSSYAAPRTIPVKKVTLSSVYVLASVYATAVSAMH